ncbi:TIGR01212 family radical SAM protein [Helicovermis profundi]|uniref:TIGR01212 family radical SAM protein n=1 Tax=Helicovermis profundi TaxID=3065157 RepID=UPI003BB0DEA4
MTIKKHYKIYSEFLKEKYHEKVYKLPINIPLTCPNRDGKIGYGGCIFCGDLGAGFENLSSKVSVKDQLSINRERIEKKYKAKKFIGYFQNYTNSYEKLSVLKKYYLDACIEDIVELCISTRPDCISEEFLKMLNEVSNEKNVQITLELGLQSINHKTLKILNRGHSLAEFIDSVIMIKKFDFDICVHLIGNLPWDDLEDFIETAKVLSALRVDLIKIHSLYILKNTKLGNMYKNGEIEICTVKDYVERVVEFIRYSSKNIVFQRLLARAPEEETLFCNWSMSWWKINDMIDFELDRLGAYQGDKCDYLGGKSIK